MSLSSVGVTALAPEESSEFDGQKVTDFGLQARDGRMLDVRDFRGGPVIVEFFASGSPACRAQLEQLIRCWRSSLNRQRKRRECLISQPDMASKYPISATRVNFVFHDVIDVTSLENANENK